MSATNTASATPDFRPRFAPRRTDQAAGAPIIVATDGTEASEPGIATARTLSKALNAPVQLISVVRPMQALLPSPDGGAGPSLEDRRLAEERLQIVREQQRLAGGGEGWTAEIKFGDPATILTRMAKARKARVLVMGRRAHGKVDQLLGDDTVFDVIRLSETPVLVASQSMAEPPTIITVAVDFSDLSTAAARTALELCPSAGLLYLVHVRPRDALGDLAAQYGSTVSEGFERMEQMLDPLTGARIDAVQLTGVLAREIVDFAENSRSKLLVVGSYKRGLFRRLAGGAMASRLMRAAPCPMLVVPEAAVEDSIEPEAGMESGGTLPNTAIDATLDELTRRNAGRRVLFEADNPYVGAQLMAFDYTFLAARFDAVSDRVHIALTDDVENPCKNLTHTLGRPTDVDIRRDIDGSDHTVRLMDRCGETRLTFW